MKKGYKALSSKDYTEKRKHSLRKLLRRSLRKQKHMRDCLNCILSRMRVRQKAGEILLSAVDKYSDSVDAI